MNIFTKDPRESRAQKLTRLTLGGALTAMGMLHFKHDAVENFASIVPPWVPGSAENTVYLSGVAELLVGTSLLTAPRARRVTGSAAAALFMAVFPANVYQYTHHIDVPGVLDTDAKRLRRLPLQLPLIAAALYVAKK